MGKGKQYELFTTESEPNSMPFMIYAKDRKSALKYINKAKLKHEKIISLRKVV